MLSVRAGLRVVPPARARLCEVVMGLGLQLVDENLASARPPKRKIGGKKEFVTDVVAVTKEDGELSGLVDRVGSARLPVLSLVDLYSDTVFDRDMCEKALLEIRDLDVPDLTARERDFLTNHAALFGRCIDGDNYFVRCVGD